MGEKDGSRMLQDNTARQDVTLLASSSGFAVPAREGSHVLVLMADGVPVRRIPLGAEPLAIGRVPPCGLVLEGSAVSRQHCRVELRNDQAWVTDSGSTNGTFVGGQRVCGTAALQHGALIQVGSHVLCYEWRTRQDLADAQAAERDLQGAASYVQTLLPKSLGAGPVRADWLFLPCRDLGGNAFGYRFLQPAMFAGYMLDVAGHGTDAAMHSVAVMNYLRQHAIPGTDFADPASVLSGLDAAFCPDEHNGMFFSIFYFTYDLPARQLRYASAGRHPAFLASPAADALTLAGDVRAVGLGEQPRTAATVAVAAGSRLILVSDGASDMLADSHAPLALQELLRRRPQPGMPEPSRIHQAIHDALGTREFAEDFTALAFEFPG